MRVQVQSRMSLERESKSGDDCDTEEGRQAGRDDGELWCVDERERAGGAATRAAGIGGVSVARDGSQDGSCRDGWHAVDG